MGRNTKDHKGRTSSSRPNSIFASCVAFSVSSPPSPLATIQYVQTRNCADHPIPSSSSSLPYRSSTPITEVTDPSSVLLCSSCLLQSIIRCSVIYFSPITKMQFLFSDVLVYCVSPTAPHSVFLFFIATGFVAL